jgi:hypothetical protein
MVYMVFVNNSRFKIALKPGLTKRYLSIIIYMSIFLLLRLLAVDVRGCCTYSF